jgi:anti-sigma B factor antagonist
MPELLSQQKDDVLIVQFTSQKILSDVLIAQIGRELLELADEADGKLLLDFQGVTFMSSAMIGKIVLLNKKCKANKTTIKLCNIAPSIKEVFEITRLNKVFSIYESLDDAVAAFGKKGWFG